jgi:hypothetical protein
MRLKGNFNLRKKAPGPVELNWCGQPIRRELGEGYGGRLENIAQGASTGDSRTARILAALRAAGTSGMTRTQILEDVCQRNVSASVLTDVLETLRQCGQADFRKEVTGGKPRERWFALVSS